MLKVIQVNDKILYPGMGMVIMAIEAAKQMAEPGKSITGFHIQELTFHAAICIPSGAEGVETGFFMRPVQSMEAKSPGWFEFRVCTCENETWTENCTGSIQIVYTPEAHEAGKDARVTRELLDDQVARYSAVQQAATPPVNDGFAYDFMAKCGLNYGKAFQLIKTVAFHREDENQVIGQVRKFSEGAETIHPTTLDAILQTAAWTMTKSGTQIMPTMVPTQVEKLWVAHDSLTRLSSNILRTHAIMSQDVQQNVSIDINAFDDELQQVIVDVSGLRMIVVSATSGDDHDDDIRALSQEKWCHHLEYKPDLNLLSREELNSICAGKYKDRAGAKTFFTELDFIVTARILETLRQLSFKQGFEPAKPHFKKYIDWMLEQKRRVDEGEIMFALEPWKSRLDNPVFIQEVEERLLKENNRGHLVVSVARNLLSFFTGEMDPLAFLFQGDQMKDFYFEAVSSHPHSCVMINC